MRIFLPTVVLITESSEHTGDMAGQASAFTLSAKIIETGKLEQLKNHTIYCKYTLYFFLSTL